MLGPRDHVWLPGHCGYAGAAHAATATRDRRASWILPRDLSSTHAARRLVRAQLAAWGYGEHSELAELLVSELVTNALRHGAGEPVVTLSSSDGVLRGEVADASPALPQVQHMSEEEECGRGLLLVEALSRDWGVERTGAGKAVWFELDV
ncbi:ATP-binding protein [Microtetraspora malaysiensis]|uniref:ATP-binding protein n=1 Tax=Microtetraspora malaysiensis TaxID=161358 RepID=UPI003D94EC54